MHLRRPRYKCDGRPIPNRALATLYGVVVIALGVEAVELVSRPFGHVGVLGVMTVLAALLALVPIIGAGRQAYVSFVAAIASGAMLLPPHQAFLLAVPPCLVDARRRPMSVGGLAVNIATFGVVALGLSELLHQREIAAAMHGDSPLLFCLITGAALLFALASNLVFEAYSAGRPALRGLVTTVGMDFVLAAMGLVVARVWLGGMHWLAPLVLVPLVYAHRAQRLPRLQEEAERDPKTRLLNMRAFATRARPALERAARRGMPISLLAIDLDRLRDINTQHGHLAGDAVIVGVGEAITNAVRSSDIVARFGGEEYAVLLPEADAVAAAEIAERIRSSVANRLFQLERPRSTIRATVSIGVVSASPHGACTDQVSDLLHAADLALYAAKGQGRNQIIVANGSLAGERHQKSRHAEPYEMPQAAADPDTNQPTIAHRISASRPIRPST